MGHYQSRVGVNAATMTGREIRTIPLKCDALGLEATGLISRDAGEHCLVSLRAGSERQRL